MVVLLPFFGLSVAAEGCEREEGAGAGPSPGRGCCWVTLGPTAPLTWLPAMRGAEGMRCSASRLCSMAVSSCSFAWHSDSSAAGTERARSARGDGASPAPDPRSPRPAPLTSRAALQPLAVLQPGVHLVAGAGEGGEGRGTTRGQDPRPRALQRRRRGSTGAAIGTPHARVLPCVVTLRCHPPVHWWGSSPWGRAQVSRPGDVSRGCSPSWQRALGT